MSHGRSGRTSERRRWSVMINHGIQVVRACWRPHFWTVRPGEATQLDPSSSTSDSDDGREWSVVHGRAYRRASTSDTVRVSPAPNAVDTGRFAVLAEQSQSKRMRVRESQATTVTAPFLEIADALEHDLTRGDTDVGSHQQRESDTESVGRQSSRHQGSVKSLRAIGRPNWRHSSGWRIAQSSSPAKMVSRECSFDMGCCRRR